MNQATLYRLFGQAAMRAGAEGHYTNNQMDIIKSFTNVDAPDYMSQDEENAIIEQIYEKIKSTNKKRTWQSFGKMPKR